MGRSVNYPSNAEFTLFMPGPESECEYDAQDDWEWFKDYLVETLTDAFPSLDPCDTWEDRECRGFLENSFGTFFLSEYCGLVSLSFKLKDLSAGYYADNDTTGLGAHWADIARGKLVTLLRDRLYVKLGSMSNGEGVYERMAA